VWPHAVDLPKHQKAGLDAHAGTGLKQLLRVYHSCTLNSLASAEFMTLALTTNKQTVGSFPSRTPTSLVLSHTTYICAPSQDV